MNLDGILLDLYGACSLDQFRRQGLACGERMFDSVMVCHNELNLADGSSLSALSRPVDIFESIRPAFFQHVHEHPSVQHHIAANGTETKAIKTSDFVTQRSWRNSGLYRNFYQPLSDIRYQLTIGQRIDDSLIFFAISRTNHDFSENERDMLTSFRPHFIQAYRNAKCHEELSRLRQCANGSREHPSPAPSRKNDFNSEESIQFVLMKRWGLSKAEARVLLSLAAGRSNGGICQHLHISLPTVKTHLEKIYRKMNVASRSEAALAVSRMLSGQ